ncbi:MAG: transcriptional regulator, partial [Clostridia bacterium]|nr:transcriptional regulator [Clostridia bacterium]
MENIFLRFLNISITAGWIVLAVVVLRLLLKKAPKWISCLLWAVVGIRLVLPFSIESIFSLIPSTTTVDTDIVYQASPSVNTGLDAVNSVVNPIITDSFAPNLGDSANPLQIWTFIAAWAWVIGIGIMLIYTIISYILLKTKVGTAVKLDENIYQSERVTSPFILGVIKPKIYLPFKISEGDIAHVIAHERAHLKRGDHLIKPIAFVLLAVYWFNPLMWVAYILLCRDIELACDEKVIRDMEHTQKQEYSKALLDLSVRRISVASCPLAFGEVGVKARIKSVMNYKKPAFWIIIVALIVCVVVSVCFLTDPINDNNSYGTKAELSDLSDIDRFENVSRIKLISPTNEVTVVVEDEVAYIKEKISQLIISDNEISKSRSEDRAADYCIMLYYDSESYTTLNFNTGCRQIWENDFVKPTFSYKVENPEAAKEIFNHSYSDPAVIQYVQVEDAILEHNKDAYLKGDVGVCTYRELLTEGKDGK